MTPHAPQRPSHRAGLGVAALLFLTPASSPAAELALSWNACPSPIQSHRQIGDGEVHTLYALVTNQAASFRGFLLELRIAAADGQSLPDPWAFHLDECPPRGDVGALSQVIPSTCRGLSGFLPRTETLTYVADPLTGGRFLSLAVIHDVRTLPAPGSTHLAAAVLFAFGTSLGDSLGVAGACDGLEREVCIRNARSSYFAADGSIVAWEATGGAATASTAAASAGGCGPVPARARTWGEIKAQYR